MTTLAQFVATQGCWLHTIPVYRQRLADTETPIICFPSCLL